ncbi:serine/threonine protein kinase [Rhodovulum sulfidophilum]|uniref:Serine/threonine protein kinase n=1 Tax=Rhodovulum sulfidophilum TaxID=35806 RepID=A0ABS1RYR8_RHOSU|nr:serine/threonine protein kinase [Rhodovulum sulfidophilum]MBL3611235.1 serine/threonine protein kinase [Rhodovulum sulfidophilum]MCE8457187.1 serine/threonine protein kinase [Rhodovulum sulfidophilum]
MSYLPYGPEPRRGWALAGLAALAAHGLLGAAVALWIGRDPVSPGPPAPRFEVTLERLDSDTLAGLRLSEGRANAADPALGPGEDSEESEDGPAPAAGPDSRPEPRGEARIEDRVESGADPRAGMRDGTAGETPSSSAPLSGALPQPVPSHRLSPVMARSGAAAVAVVPDRIAPVGTGAGSGTASGTGIARRPASASSEPRARDLAAAALIRRIRETPAPDCLLALPRRDAEGGAGLDLMAASEAGMADYAGRLLTGDLAGTAQRRRLIDPRQCPVLELLRDSPDYPATRLGLGLDRTEIVSGGRLTGRLRGVGGRYVLLLLIDNNGVVQDLQRFLSFAGNRAKFEVPVSLAGPARDTSQLLLAVAADGPVSGLRAQIGRRADEVFSSGRRTALGAAALALAGFDLR